MDLDDALDVIRGRYRAVLATTRPDGEPQLSPVLVTVDAEGYVVISSRETAYKVRNLRRRPRASVCVFPDTFFGRWIQVEGSVDIVSMPDALPGLEDYYRSISGEHPDWDEYRAAMRTDRRVLVCIRLDRAGPDREG